MSARFKQIGGYFKFGMQLLSPHRLWGTIVFNFYYLPIRQAIRLPIWIYKPKFVKLRGKVRIEGRITPGMILLGPWGGHMYPNNGIYWMNEGEVTFRGKCFIGNNSFILTGKDGKIIFGPHFLAPTSAKIISYKGIEFGERVSLGFQVTVMDTNFHPLYDRENQQFRKAYGKIRIGDHNWFGAECFIMHSVTTPPRCIFGLRSVITRGAGYESYCVHGNTSAPHILSRNVMLDYENHYMVTDYNA